jgi:ubiquinone/menaquinone biosynthesis C-methylase UbiE
MDNNLYVQYGCGWSAAKGWLNYDASPTLIFERLPIVGKLFNKNAKRFPDIVEYGDIVKGLPIKENSCTGVYCSHVLEHLSLDDFRYALKNTYKILKKGGVFRAVLPDLELAINDYIKNDSTDAALIFMESTSLGKKERQRGLKGLLIEWLGNSKHLWMWDYKSFEAELVRIGFNKIRKAQFGDSIDPTFKEVEEVGRWDKSFGVECIK